MSDGLSTTDMEMHPLEDHEGHQRPHPLPDDDAIDLRSQENAHLEGPHLGQVEAESRTRLLTKEEPLSSQPNSKETDEGIAEPRKTAVDGRRWVAFLRCISHLLPLAIAVGIIALNASHVYWQDLGE